MSQASERSSLLPRPDRSVMQQNLQPPPVPPSGLAMDRPRQPHLVSEMSSCTVMTQSLLCVTHCCLWTDLFLNIFLSVNHFLCSSLDTAWLYYRQMIQKSSEAEQQAASHNNNVWYKKRRYCRYKQSMSSLINHMMPKTWRPGLHFCCWQYCTCMKNNQKSVDFGPQFLAEGPSHFWTCVFKFGLLPNMWHRWVGLHSVNSMTKKKKEQR